MITGLSKIQRKREGLTNGKERRIRNLLIPRIMYVFAGFVGARQCPDHHSTRGIVIRGTGSVGLGQMRMHLAISAPWSSAGRACQGSPKVTSEASLPLIGSHYAAIAWSTFPEQPRVNSRER